MEGKLDFYSKSYHQQINLTSEFKDDGIFLSDPRLQHFLVIIMVGKIVHICSQFGSHIKQSKANTKDVINSSEKIPTRNTKKGLQLNCPWVISLFEIGHHDHPVWSFSSYFLKIFPLLVIVPHPYPCWIPKIWPAGQQNPHRLLAAVAASPTADTDYCSCLSCDVGIWASSDQSQAKGQRWADGV